MTSEKFTTRNVAKFVLKSIVAGKTSQITERAITDYTAFDEDDMIVDIAGTVVGWYVASKIQPVTNAIVDKTADYFVARKEANQAKKNESTETKKTR